MKREDRIRRAQLSQELLDNELYKSAFADVREGLVKAVEGCKWDDGKTQNNLMLSLQLLKGLENVIKKHIQDGFVAQKEIERVNKPKRFGR
jgi:hypothetical protein